MIPPSVLTELDGFVAAAGGYVELAGKVLSDNRFPAELAARVVSLLDRHNVAYLLEAPEAVYGPPGVDRRLTDLLKGHLPTSGGPEREGPLDILAALRMSGDLTSASFGKITCFDSPVPISALAGQIGPELSALPSSIPDMGASAGEIYLSWIHKAVGIQTVIDHLDTDRRAVVAIGDGLNDVEMLEFAATAVAIQGSDPRVLAVADHIVPGPDRGGLSIAFAELGLTTVGTRG